MTFLRKQKSAKALQKADRNVTNQQCVSKSRYREADTKSAEAYLAVLTEHARINKLPQTNE